mmetsp:Transcript_66466/g.185253  ORF Transcript_66466/g.185253 Transcript_66466/m.185253 type:complete len:339 (-) Transcript_66466:657-1673(-)
MISESTMPMCGNSASAAESKQSRLNGSATCSAMKSPTSPTSASMTLPVARSYVYLPFKQQPFAAVSSYSPASLMMNLFPVRIPLSTLLGIDCMALSMALPRTKPGEVPAAAAAMAASALTRLRCTACEIDSIVVSVPPPSKYCSARTSSATTSTMRFTVSTSDMPSLSRFDTSTMPRRGAPLSSTAPRTVMRRFKHHLDKSSLSMSSGSFTMIPTLIAVPRFEGHEVKKPRRSLCAKPPDKRGSWLREALTWSSAPMTSAKASRNASPDFTVTARRCSSSLIHTEKDRESATKTPRASGQCRPTPLQSAVVESGWLNNNFARSSSSSCSGVRPPSFGA